MNSHIRPSMVTGMGMATAATLVATAVALPISHTVSAAPTPSVFSAFALMDHQEGWNGNGHNEGDHHEGDHHGGGILSFVSDFLANNQAAIESFAQGVPTFYLGPIAVGQGVLADAYYNGYNGSATGLPGVVAYVKAQIGNVTEFLQNIKDAVKNTVETVTHLLPVINLGPLAIGGGLLADAFFNGYNGSATGVAGIISYVTASLGVQAGAAKTVAGSAAAALPRAAASTVTVATPKPAASRAVRAAAAVPSAAAGARTSVKAAGAKAASQGAPKAAASRHAR